MKRTSLLAAVLGALLTNVVVAADWPTWRYDAQRSAASPAALPEDLQLVWQRQLPENHVAWSEDPRLQFDAGYEPIVVGKTMLVASARSDSITALDTDSGQERWKFFADGPIRFAPVAWQGRAYFGADDGNVYCVEIASGKLAWKFNAAPTDRRVIGNDRLISVWPVRGGAVVGDGKLYFSVGVWPFEGALLYTVDLQSSNENVPHYTVKSLNELVPQGYLVFNNERLYIPSGRAKASCIDLATGDSVPLAFDAPGMTDYHLTSAGNLLFHGTKVYDTAAQRQLSFDAPRPLSDGNVVYGRGEKSVLQAFDTAQRETHTTKDRRGSDVQRDRVAAAWQWANEHVVQADQPFQLLIKAGNRLFGSRGSTLFAVEVPTDNDNGEPSLSWLSTIEGHPHTMVAADDKLFVVTREGRLLCYSGERSETQSFALAFDQPAAPNEAATSTAEKLLRKVNDPTGYCLVLGIESGHLIMELARQSNMRIIAVDARPEKVAALRRRADAAGIYGTKVVAIEDDPHNVALPPYLAELVTSESQAGADIVESPSLLARIFKSIRPYGGRLALQLDESGWQQLRQSVSQLDLPHAELSVDDDVALLSRVGALPGAADWTHEYGDPANTLMSSDILVRAPLGVLWFGGPAGKGELYFDRHYWGPSLTVVGGRMFVQGPRRLTAIDIYTGRVLWKVDLRDGSGPGRRGNFFDIYRLGFHCVAVEDSIYLVYEDVCLRLDPKTGETLAELKLPDPADKWGKVRVYEDMLIATLFREHPEMGLLPRAVTAVQRYDGHTIWSHDAEYSVPVMAVGGGQVFLFDGILQGFYDAWKRQGLVPKSQPVRYLKALDVKSGAERWKVASERIVTWIAHSPQHDIVVATNKRGLDAIRAADGDSLWQADEEAPGFGGHPENVWDKVILAGDLVIDQRGPGRAFNLQTGAPIEDVHPITGETTTWQFTKTGHHCNYAIASPHMITFRADTAGFYDRHTKGTARLSGFRSGCRNSLIPAGGVLNAPNFAHGCSCGFNIFTSLALVHVPDADLWTYNAYESSEAAPQRFGINFGAPGDRVAENQTLWMEYPPASDPSASLPVQLAGDSLKWYRLLTSQIESEKLRWVAASGVHGLTEVRLPLPGDRPAEYTVKMIFAEPFRTAAGARVFDVSLQGESVLRDLDIVQEAGGTGQLLEKQFTGVAATDEIVLSFSATRGEPLICGIEVIAEPLE